MIKINRDAIKVKGNPLIVLGEFITAIYNFKNTDWDNTLPSKISDIVIKYANSIKDPAILLVELAAQLKQMGG